MKQMVAIQWKQGDTLLDHYRIEGILGYGGMGVVYKVRRTFDDRLYAVKSLLADKLDDPHNQRTFLRELRTWIELPDNPHIVKCYFFQTISGQRVIFSEYVDGGALSNRIGSGRISNLKTALDLGIQMAWGLQVAHDNRIVHQDVKPSNFLVTRDGIVKVTDFGLARARHKIGLETMQAPAETTDGPLVTSTGMTLAFCSPEQAMGKKLSLRTDIWSWGLSFLQIFTGTVTWRIGALARETIEDIAESDGKKLKIPIPASVMELFHGCFQRKPDKRWPSLRNIADRLSEIYAVETGEPYPRICPVVSEKRRHRKKALERQSLQGRQYDDPVHWLEKGLNVLGKTLDDAESALNEKVITRKARALVDLEVFNEAIDIFTNLHSESPEYALDLAGLLRETGTVHEALNDLPGAMACYDRALALYPSVPDGDTDHLTIRNYVMTALYKANLYLAMNDLPTGMQWLEHTIETARKTTEERCRKALGVAMMNRAIAASRSGDYADALERFDDAIAYNRHLVGHDKVKDMLNILLLCHTNKGILLKSMGKLDAALDFFKTSCSLGEQLVNVEKKTEYEAHLAVIYINLASMMLDHQSDPDEALMYINKALIILEPYVVDDDRWEGASMLLQANRLKLRILQTQGHIDHVFKMLQRCMKLARAIMDRSGRVEHLETLAFYEQQRGELYLKQGQWNEGLEAFERSEALCRQALKSSEIESTRWQEVISRGWSLVAQFKAGHGDAAMARFEQTVNELNRLKDECAPYEDYLTQIQDVLDELIVHTGGSNESHSL